MVMRLMVMRLRS